MTWANSKIFRPYLADVLGNISAIDLDADTFHAALFNNSITPDNDVTSANSAYNVGQWASANEVTDVTNWVAGGRPLGTQSLDSSVADVVFFDAANTAGGGTVTLAANHGCLVYDQSLATPVDNQGICYNYFGGAQSVTGGTFTIVWHANGVFRITL
jgi:hypothetical protein